MHFIDGELEERVNLAVTFIETWQHCECIMKWCRMKAICGWVWVEDPSKFKWRETSEGGERERERGDGGDDIYLAWRCSWCPGIYRMLRPWGASSLVVIQVVEPWTCLKDVPLLYCSDYNSGTRDCGHVPPQCLPYMSPGWVGHDLTKSGTRVRLVGSGRLVYSLLTLSLS